MSVRIRSVTASGCALLLTVPIRNGAEAGSDSNESAAGMLPRKNNPCVLGGARLSFPVHSGDLVMAAILAAIFESIPCLPRAKRNTESCGENLIHHAAPYRNNITELFERSCVSLPWGIST